MTATTTQLVYTRDEAADALRISKAKVDQAIRSGALPAKKVGRDVLIPASSLAVFIAALPDA